MPTHSLPKVALFSTCIGQILRQSMVHAAAQILAELPVTLVTRNNQTCCGQVGYNSGHHEQAKNVAKHTIRTFADLDYLIGVSGSCVGMIKEHYPKLFANDPEWQQKALALAQKTFEFSQFLTEFAYVPKKILHGEIHYHASCSSYRELGIFSQPLMFLQQAGLSVSPLDQEVCCGFGGSFCAKYSQLSAAMADNKLAQATAQHVVGLDFGCLMHLDGRAQKTNKPLYFWHFAEVLAGHVPDLIAP